VLSWCDLYLIKVFFGGSVTFTFREFHPVGCEFSGAAYRLDLDESRIISYSNLLDFWKDLLVSGIISQVVGF